MNISKIFDKFDLFEDIVDKNTLQIKNYELAYKLKRYLECDEKFNAYSNSRDIGIMDYVSSMSRILKLRYKPSLLNMAITLLENDLPIKIVADITKLDVRLIEKLDKLSSDSDGERECIVKIEERHEIANNLLKLNYLKVEDIAKKTKLTVDEIEALKKDNN